ncbi:zinc finger BED domain-containing protein RICESLEEPER 2-like [Pistacia vera]|uniref:zinc finger BED domain-containing protein RICESLEEPER 2-like n=1 Tax=Pistacia vera TaxID=55513 RepID=UPI001263362F|nr:zinc finger BED domain-containing protein RICESLEEPER 2-like [Pistacia vera]
MVENCILEWGIEDHVSTLTVDDASANDVAINYLKDRLVDRNVLIMDDTTIKFKKAFQMLEDEDPNFAIDSHETPSVDDWEKAIVFAKFLETFYEATKRMSGTKYVTSNNYFDEIVSIVFTLNDWENDPNPCLHSMSKKMREKFDKYYGSLDKANVMVLVATVLDPRYKMIYVSWCYKKIYGNDLAKVEMMTTNLRDVLERLFGVYDRLVSHVERGQASISFPPMGTNQSSVGVVASDATVKYHPFKDAFLEEMDVGVVDDNKSELEQYLEEKCEPMKCELSVLDWWKANKGKYKVLSHMARDVFAISVSTIASELAFSISGHVLDQFQSSLSPGVV